jgi:hypothetical protein
VKIEGRLRGKSKKKDWKFESLGGGKELEGKFLEFQTFSRLFSLSNFHLVSLIIKLHVNKPFHPDYTWHQKLWR